MNFKPKSFHLQWHITERCNLNCSHCYQDPELMSEEASFENLVCILDNFVDLIKKWNLPKRAVRVSITGGEPLIRNNFFDFLEKVESYKEFFKYGILTNGVLINEEKLEKIKERNVDYLQISIEGLKVTNDKIRGDGVYENIIETTDLIKNNSDIDLAYSLTASKNNLDEIPKVIKLADEKNVGLGIRRHVPYGRGKQMMQDMLSPDQLRALWHYIIKNNLNVHLGCEDDILIQDLPEYRTAGCSAGYLSFTVMPNGDVYPCRRLPLFSGNLLKESFEDIYYNSEIMKKIRDLNNLNDVCGECPNVDRCNGGAKCLSQGYFGDYSNPDPHCWRLFNELPDPDLKWRKTPQRKKINNKWVNFDES